MASNAKKLTYWQQHSKRCKTSGLTRRADCAATPNSLNCQQTTCARLCLDCGFWRRISSIFDLIVIGTLRVLPTHMWHGGARTAVNGAGSAILYFI